MFKKILIPTDGSDLATHVALEGVEFAKQIGAEVIGVFVAPEFRHPIYVEVLPPDYPSDEEFHNTMREVGKKYLTAIQDAAHASGLKFSGFVEFSDLTAQKIARTADEQQCDLIFIGSHGRSGLGQLLLGSVTAKLLSTCSIPVLVHRHRESAK